jgi:hypothetical protein
VCVCVCLCVRAPVCVVRVCAAHRVRVCSGRTSNAPVKLSLKSVAMAGDMSAVGDVKSRRMSPISVWPLALRRPYASPAAAPTRALTCRWPGRRQRRRLCSQSALRKSFSCGGGWIGGPRALSRRSPDPMKLQPVCAWAAPCQILITITSIGAHSSSSHAVICVATL